MAHIEDELKQLLKLTRINYKDVIDSSPYRLSEFQQKNRRNNIVVWRQFVVVFARLQGLKLIQAGAIVEQDHAMVIRALKLINKRLPNKQYPEYLEVLNIIKNNINVNFSSSEDMNINEMNCLILLDHLISKKYANAN
jgi:chromosomal replication initiation ATPase DnaA